MKKLMLSLLSSTPMHWSFVIPRVVIGCTLAVHGWQKIQKGPEMWAGLGGAMGQIGISFAPSFWGFLAVAAEFGGGLAVALGLFTRIGAAGAAFTMFIATLVHYNGGDGFNKYSHPLELMVVFLAFMLAGSGPFSIDSLLRKKM